MGGVRSVEGMQAVGGARVIGGVWSVEGVQAVGVMLIVEDVLIFKVMPVKRVVLCGVVLVATDEKSVKCGSWGHFIQLFS